MGMRTLHMVLIISWLLCQRVVQAHYSRNQPLNKILMDKKEAVFFLSHGSRVERSATPSFCYDRAQERVCEARHMDCQTEEFREYLCTKERNACPSNLMCTIDGIWCPVHYRTHCTNVCDVFGPSVPRCKNGGTCMNIRAENYTCSCLPGFIGKDCENDIDECMNQPCPQGVSCTNTFGNYSCNCSSRFMGQNCEIDVCDNLGPNVPRCKNGGTCMNIRAENYTCICLPGFAGKDCEIDIDECVNGPCQQNASCTNSFGSYSCNCPSRFMGQNCEIEPGSKQCGCYHPTPDIA